VIKFVLNEEKQNNQKVSIQVSVAMKLDSEEQAKNMEDSEVRILVMDLILDKFMVIHFCEME
jgi:hypothetical protein